MIGYLVVLLLVASAILGASILLVDDVLWHYAPLHAYGLTAFVILNILSISLVFLRARVGFLATLVFGMIQLSGMISNLIIGAQVGVTGFSQAELTEYLLGTAKGVAEGYGFWKLSPFAYDALIIMQFPILLITLALYRKKAWK